MSSTMLFSDLGLPSSLLTSIKALGYENATPIQEKSIPIMLQKSDLLAQAQTGTGKTAAFALPILSNIDLAKKVPQALVIAPTRELAIQVSEAFHSYAKHLKGFHVAPIYGGQDYQIQLKALKRGTHVVVGTPGRVMDHMRRGTLSVKNIKTLVLDEADEMLNMGFIESIDWILSEMEQEHQTALFSATMPYSIEKIAQKYLKDAHRIQIEAKESKISTIEQFFTRAVQSQKLDVLTRFLEVEDVQASIVFARTKNISSELAEKLQARGYAAAALNGDMSQSAREKVISRLKAGTLDIVVATDVAARGIDVERVSHVFNYDIPYDSEAYIHRIGRTGRAGRKGKAYLFITPRESRLFNEIQRSVKQPITEISPPSVKDLHIKRDEELTEKVVGIIAKSKKLTPFHKTVDKMITNHNLEAKDVAAALAYLLQQANPLPTEEIKTSSSREGRGKHGGRDRYDSRKKFSGSRKKSGERRSRSGDDSSNRSTRRRFDDKKTSSSKGKKRFVNPNAKPRFKGSKAKDSN